MTLKQWLAEGRLRTHAASRAEIHELLAKVQRDLEDASIVELSIDRRFMIAYDAALTLATIALYATGYETRGRDHHWLTFRTLPVTMGEDLADLADYFDQCRTKRNVGTYDRPGQISRGELDELMQEVRRFRDLVLNWLREYHPSLG